MAGGFGGAVKLTGEAEYRQAITRITQSLRECGAEMKLVSSQYAASDTSQEALNARTKALNNTLEQQKAKLVALQGQERAMHAQYTSSNEAHQKLTASLEAERDKLSQIEASQGKNSEAYQTQAKAVIKLSSAVDKSSAAVNYNEIAMSKIRQQMVETQANINKTESSIKKLSTSEESAGTSSKNLGKHVEEAGDKVEEAGEKAKASGSKFSAAFGAISGVAQSMASKVMDALGGLKDEIVNTSDATDKFQSTLKFAGIDDSKIKELTESTRKYADQTVYDLSDIQSMTAQLAANGVDGYDKLAEAAGNLNAVAGGNADTFKSVGMVLTQTAGAGKLTTENWNQLADAIPGASGKLQEAMQKNGAYTGNFRDAMAKGEITADEFNKAIMDLGFTDAAKQAATSTSTIEGAMGNLQASVVGGFTDMLNKVKPKLTDAISSLADWVTNAFQSIQDFSGKAMAFFQDLANSPQFQNLKDGLSAIGDAAKTAFDNIKTAVQPVIDSIKSLADRMGLLGNGSDAVSNAADKIKDAMGKAGDVLKGVADAMKSISDWCAQHADGVSSALVAIGGGFAAFKMASLISGAITALKGFSLAAKMAALAQAALNLVMSLNPIMIVVTAVGALAAGLVYFFSQTDTGRQKWGEFCQALQDFWNNVVSTFQVTWGYIGQKFSDLGNGIKNTWQSVVDFVGGVPGRIQGFFAGIGSWFSNKFQEVKSGITSKFNDAVDAVKKIPDKFKDIGKNIIQGLWSGIESVKQWLKDKISSIADWIPGWIKDRLGIHSPSRVMRDQVGKYIAQGIGVGFESEMSAVKAQMLDAMPSPDAFAQDYSFGAVNAASSGYRASGDGYQSDIVSAITEALKGVQVVLDDEVAGRFVTKTVTAAIYR